MNLRDLSFIKGWTLFLDRDGVINQRIQGGYVTSPKEFLFIDGVLEALQILAGIFPTIVIVSNQQGIGKGLMDNEALWEVDRMMKAEITGAGGRIDASYYSPYLEIEGHPDRKPGPGLATRARSEFPSIDFQHSVMVGDTRSDMEFGKNLGMTTVLIADPDNPENPTADFVFESLYQLARKLKTKN